MQDIDTLITEFFSVFDNRNGKIPNLSDLDLMFLPDAIITKCNSDNRESMSLHDFITPREVLLKNGSLTEFHEWEVSENTFMNGVTATRICKYEKEGLLDGNSFSGSGMKSIQLIKSQLGWQIISILWEDFE